MNGYSFVPSLGVIVTDKCDLACEYCPPHGENVWRAIEECDVDVISCVLQVAKRHDTKVVRITGGEPLLFPERTRFVLTEACKLGFEKLILNTNGTQLLKHIDWLVDFKDNFLLKISLDTIDPMVFERITGRNHKFLQNIINGIRQATEEGFEIEINSVSTKSNAGAVLEVLKFAEELDVHLKIFDVFDFGGIVKVERVSLDGVRQHLNKHYHSSKGERLPGNRGIEMEKFYRNSGKHVLIVNYEGTHASTIYYSEDCLSCSFYPCKTGRFQIPLRSDGILLACRLNRSEGIDLKGMTCKNINDAYQRQLIRFTNCFEQKPM